MVIQFFICNFKKNVWCKQNCYKLQGWGTLPFSPIPRFWNMLSLWNPTPTLLPFELLHFKNVWWIHISFLDTIFLLKNKFKRFLDFFNVQVSMELNCFLRLVSCVHYIRYQSGRLLLRLSWAHCLQKKTNA